MIYHETEHGILYHGDCLDIMKTLPDNSVDAVVTDPPYNIDKVRDWDKWKTKEGYIEWCGKWIAECVRLLKDNGSIYIFHNDMPQIAMLMEWIRLNTPLVFKQFIVWNKRFNGSPNKGYMDGYCAVDSLRNYQQLAEYLLYYTFQDQTGLTTVMLDTNNFSTLRQYFKDYQEALGLTKLEILERVGQCADHCFRWGSSQWDLPTAETYSEIGKLPINGEFVRREYEDLRREYEDLRYVFNNQKTHHSVWNYDFAPKQGHITPKPLDLMENIIKHSTNEGQTVLDPFLGSGTTALACVKQGRRYIGIELNPKYCDIAVKRIESELDQTDIFREES